MSDIIRSHRQLTVFNSSMEAAVAIHFLAQKFPTMERRNLTDQILRSSRSVCGNIAEAWRRRRYVNNFISKLVEVQGEAAETQVWLEFASRVGYVQAATFDRLFDSYEHILAQLTLMTRDAGKWTRG